MEISPTDLEAQQKAREAAEREAGIKREREIADFKRVMEDAHGRRFVWRLMEEAGVFQEGESSLELGPLSYERGMRRQGLKLLKEVMSLCPEAWLQMIKDQKR